tara:strand:- start:40 stop:384 length:345 start_codon:yes stop_codon:yes gene_type:complete
LLVVLVGVLQVAVTALVLLLVVLVQLGLVIVVALLRQYLALAPEVVALVERVSLTLAVILQEPVAPEHQAVLQAAQSHLLVAVEAGDLQQAVRVDQVSEVRVELTLRQQDLPGM